MDPSAPIPFPTAPQATCDDAWTAFEAAVEPDARFQYSLERLAPIVRGEDIEAGAGTLTVREHDVACTFMTQPQKFGCSLVCLK